MSKEDFIRAHEREVAEYLDRHPQADWQKAYDATADRAWDRMREDAYRLDDAADFRRQLKEEDGQ